MHPCPLGARLRKVRHIKHARQAVRVGASSSHPKKEIEKHLNSIGVKKNRMPPVEGIFVFLHAYAVQVLLCLLLRL
jgi:hypothetical protein